MSGSFPAEPRAGAHVPSTLQGLDKCSTSAAIGRGGNERYICHRVSHGGDFGTTSDYGADGKR